MTSNGCKQKRRVVRQQPGDLVLELNKPRSGVIVDVKPSFANAPDTRSWHRAVSISMPRKLSQTELGSLRRVHTMIEPLPSCVQCAAECAPESSVRCASCRRSRHIWCMEPRRKGKHLNGLAWMCSTCQDCVGKDGVVKRSKVRSPDASEASLIHQR